MKTKKVSLSAACRKKEYDAPVVEIMNAHVEKGFAVSGEGGEVSGQMETYGKGETNAIFS